MSNTSSHGTEDSRFVNRQSKISVVIPTLNEAKYIEQTLRTVQQQRGPKEVLVVDGDSADNTVARAASLADRVLTEERGRAQQMNRGAAVASGDVLLFLHADTHLSDGSLAAIRRALTDPSAEAGTFRLTFDRDAPLLCFYGFCTRLPWHRLCFGDRGFFVRRRAFEAVGGFPAWPLFEDLELAHRLHRRGGLCYLPEAVTTSARRFEAHGALRQQLQNLHLWLHYIRGGDPEQVADQYAYEQ